MHRVNKRLEVRGVPFVFCTWTHLERIIWPAGTLRKIVSNELQIGDPNCVCLDIEVDGEKEVPHIILTAAEGGRDTKIMIAALPPPPRCLNAHTIYPALARQREWYSPQQSTKKRRAGNPTLAIRAARLGFARQVFPRLRHPRQSLRRKCSRLSRTATEMRTCCATPGDVHHYNRGLLEGAAAGSHSWLSVIG